MKHKNNAKIFILCISLVLMVFMLTAGVSAALATGHSPVVTNSFYSDTVSTDDETTTGSEETEEPSEAVSETEAEAESESETETVTEAVTETEASSETETESATEASTETTAQSETESESESETESDTESETGSVTEAESESETETGTSYGGVPTGDDTNLIIWYIALAASVLILAVCIVIHTLRQKRTHKE